MNQHLSSKSNTNINIVLNYQSLKLQYNEVWLYIRSYSIHLAKLATADLPDVYWVQIICRVPDMQ